MPNLGRSAAFAFLIPISVDAKKTLKLHVDLALLEHSEPHRPISLGFAGESVAKLDYALIFGRRCLSFASSHADQVHFLPADDIDRHHFILHFDMSTPALLLTDTSAQGIWVTDDSTQPAKRLYHATLLLSQRTDILFGQSRR